MEDNIVDVLLLLDKLDKVVHLKQVYFLIGYILIHHFDFIISVIPSGMINYLELNLSSSNELLNSRNMGNISFFLYHFRFLIITNSFSVVTVVDIIIIPSRVIILLIPILLLAGFNLKEFNIGFCQLFHNCQYHNYENHNYWYYYHLYYQYHYPH